MPFDKERIPEEEDEKEEKRKKQVGVKSSPNTKKVGKKYMFDPQPLEEDELAEWER